MAVTKRKGMTVAEKKRKARIKKELQEKGILPPDKKRLNRKKFCEETIEEWEHRNSGYADHLFIMRAMSVMLYHTDNKHKRSLEAVGTAKVLKIALALKAYHEELKAEGKSEYSVVDEYEVIKDILNA